MYWSEVKVEARLRVSRSLMVQGCQAGDRAMICALLIVFWRFVYDFAQILYTYFETTSDPLVKRMKGSLSGIADDEKSHRLMWSETAKYLGITDLLDLNKERFQRVIFLSEYLSQNVTPAYVFLRIVAVEVVAEALSEELLSSMHFKAILPRRFQRWFIAHIVHGEGTTHEQLALKLALHDLAHGEYTDIESIVRAEVLGLIDLFVDAATYAPLVARELEFSQAA